MTTNGHFVVYLLFFPLKIADRVMLPQSSSNQRNGKKDVRLMMKKFKNWSKHF